VSRDAIASGVGLATEARPVCSISQLRYKSGVVSSTTALTSKVASPAVELVGRKRNEAVRKATEHGASC